MSSRHKIFYRHWSADLKIDQFNKQVFVINKSLAQEIKRFRKDNQGLTNSHVVYLLLHEHRYRKNILLAVSKAILKEDSINTMNSVLDQVNGQLTYQEKVYYDHLIQCNLIPAQSPDEEVSMWWIPDPRYFSGKKSSLAVTKRAAGSLNNYKKQQGFKSAGKALVMIIDEFLHALRIITVLLKTLQKRKGKDTLLKILNNVFLTLRPVECAVLESLVKDIFPD